VSSSEATWVVHDDHLGGWLTGFLTGEQLTAGLPPSPVGVRGSFAAERIPHQIRGGGVALGVRIRLDDHFSDIVDTDSGEQFADPQLVGADAGQRIELVGRSR
jgi:hypothetical protein